MNTKIKICGITNIPDALMAVRAGADAVGMVFAPSKRMVDKDLAKAVVQRMPPFVTTVGVFMDSPIEDVNRIIECTGIDIAQLHGNESPDYCRRVRARVVKRIAVNDNTTAGEISRSMARYSVPAFLFDPGAGSGASFDWNMLIGVTGNIIIAGGLNPENVREAVILLKPCGVDVSSGVENADGKKDPEKVAKFIREVRRCSLPE
jgi:phosphoribosylanthranilate isomerase